MKMGDFREKCENEQKVRLFVKKSTVPARGGNPSIAQHILMVLGAQSALWGKSVFFMKIMEFHEIHGNFTFFMKIMEIFNC